MPAKKIIGSAIIAGAIAGAGLAAAIVGAPGISGAQSTATSTPAVTAPAAVTPDPGVTAAPATPADPADPNATARTPRDPSQGGHVGANGTKEVLLTGDTAAKVTAAALAAVPGGTVERVENDAEGSAYEAHMTKADGTHVTVKVGADFAVSTIETGPAH